MNNLNENLNEYYGRAGLFDRIKNALVANGHDLSDLHREHMAGFDEFHIGGRTETRNLATMAGLEKNMMVLDLGGGIGGPARTIAEEFGCAVKGLDVTAEFCRTADQLSELLGLSERVVFRQGTATAIPFEDDEFDAVWMQHAGMNIADKERLYSEVARVLKPNGKFLLHEILKDNSDELHFPVLWADRPELSSLVSEPQLHDMLNRNGLNKVGWEDVSARSLQWFEHIQEENKTNGHLPVGIALIFDSDPSVSAANVFRNLKEGRIKVVQGCFELTK